MKYLMVNGFIRSGTTLLNKALDAHSKIATANDPFLPFFNQLYKKYEREINGVEIDDDAPIRDCFLVPTQDKKKFKKEIFSLDFSKRDIKKLKSNLEAFNTGWPEQHAPKLVPYLDELSPGGSDSILRQLFNLVEKAYATEKTEIVGFKDTWCEEFITPLIQELPQEIHCVTSIRDIRAAYYSRHSGDYFEQANNERHALLFTIRNWRKSLAFALKNEQYTHHDLVKYESFVENPKPTLGQLCETLGTSYEPAMVNVNNYRDGTGRSWTSNSSFEEKSTIDTSSVDKWRDQINTSRQKILELTCRPELLFFDYLSEYTSESFSPELMQYSEKKENIRNYHIKYGYEWTRNRVQEEILRIHLFENGNLDRHQEIISEFFINPSVYDTLNSRI